MESQTEARTRRREVLEKVVKSSLVTVKMSVCLSYVNHISSASLLMDTYLVTESTNGICQYIFFTKEMPDL